MRNEIEIYEGKVESMIKVSVILPVYNEEKYLEQCLDSICSQTLREIEIICIDDGSVDRSLQILQSYEKQDKRIKVITQQNRYAGTARNHGMKYAVGKYLSFLDSDDYFEPDMLEKMYNKAEDLHSDIVICRYAEHCEKSGKTTLKDCSFEDLFFNERVFGEKECFQGALLNCAGIFQVTKGWAWDKLFRTEFVKNCGYKFPDFRSSEDGFFVYMLMARAERISYMDDVLAVHRINNKESLSNTKEKNWINGLKMWLMIGKELKVLGLFSIYRQSFLNEMVFFFIWYMDSMEETETRRKCREYIKQVLEPEFQIQSYERENYFQEEVYDWYQEQL